MRRFYCIFILWILFIQSCDSSHKRNDEWRGKDIPLRGNKLVGDIQMYTPRDFIWVDSFFIIGDFQNDPVYKIFNYDSIQNTFHFYSSFGNKGKGPQEFLFPMPLEFTDTEIIIGDQTLSRYAYIKKEDLQQKKISAYIHTEDLPAAKYFVSFMRMDSNTFIGNSFKEPNMFTIYYRDTLFDSSIAFPEDYIDCSAAQKSLVYQGRLIRHPKENKVAYTSFYGNIFEIYEFNNLKMNKLFSHIEEFPKYMPIKNSHQIYSANLHPDCMTGYLKSFSTEKYIYLLYSGKTTKKAKSRKNFSNLIYVWDWEGHPINKLILDYELSTFFVTNDDKNILGLYNILDLNNLEEQNGVVKFEINLK